MSRQRSHSPSYRGFPWEEPHFEAQKIAAQDRMPMGRGDRVYWEGEDYPERRHPHYQQHMQHSEEAHHRRKPSPHRELAHFERRNDGPKHRETYREKHGRYEDRRGPPQPEHNRNYAQRDHGWRQVGPERESRERFRDRSPIKQEGNWQRGRGTGQQRRRTPTHTNTWISGQDHPDLNRNRDTDDSLEFGYGWQKPHGHRDEYDRNTRGPLDFKQNPNDPTEVMPPPRREQFSRSREQDFPPKPGNSRSLSKEDKRGGYFVENRNHDGYQEASRSPIAHEGLSFAQYTDRAANRGRPANRGCGLNQRAGFNHRGRGRGAPNNLPKQQRENAPCEPQRSPFMEEFYDEPKRCWDDREPEQAWRDDGASADARRGDGRDMKLQRQDLEMQRRPQETRGRNEPKPNMMVVTKETLTIKVDMSRPVNKNSAMLYSADRQLSLDLVHVGRQRLDFLSTAENLGANRENAVQHTGTFAQEIIMLTHLVKELYFGGDRVTLDERFSAPQRGGYEADELHELTLSERFSANRLKVNSNMDSDDPLFMSQGPLQLLGSPMVRDPDDLRHDLEKRRQERLDGVKVTIAGQTRPQRPPLAPPVHNSEPMFIRNHDVAGEAETLNWADEPDGGREEPMQGPRRGGPLRSNAPFRRNNRQMRRPNYRHNNSGHINNNNDNDNNNGGPNW
ncbi:uncharacterized protein [Eucyclogobius newberryi]|uniref:uncharacterized protein n=1 Tax=Eucyclogobius newberryi TaxID=166745 RepID=UPI003B58B74C